MRHMNIKRAVEEGELPVSLSRCRPFIGLFVSCDVPLEAAFPYVLISETDLFE